MNGETVTGVSIMRAEAGLDTGPVLLAAEEPIREDDTAGMLTERLSHLGARLLVEAIGRIEAGAAEYVPQDEKEATHAPLITAEVAAMNWSRTADALRNQVRGLNSKPGAVTRYEGRDLKVWAAEVVEGQGAPGEVIGIEAGGPVVAAGGGGATADGSAARRVAADGRGGVRAGPEGGGRGPVRWVTGGTDPPPLGVSRSKRGSG
jgi:methionyl-tRNA formyltransferase